MANVSDYYYMRVYTALNGQVGLNVYTYACVAKAGTGASDVQIAQGFDTTIAAAYKALLSTNATYRGVQVQKYFPLPVLVAASSVASSGNGTAGAQNEPTQTAGLLSLRTAQAGKSKRGRAYIPFPASADTDATGRPFAAYVTRLNTLATALLVNFTAGAGGNTNQFTLNIHSKLLGSFQPVTNIIASPFWASQRRRSDFGAKNTLPI